MSHPDGKERVVRAYQIFKEMLTGQLDTIKTGVVTLIRRSTGRTGSGRLCRQGYMLPRRNCRYAEQSVGPS